ncbi:MAG: tyrosine-type recombinase/integrase [Bacteroidetes bacterium]|nr:tyrosine-type recombinase/integrase [Bacteroidota bacterium]MBU1718438.1 tyrosine-type recombinase/integrase [Bacteroidota bacterium]
MTCPDSRNISTRTTSYYNNIVSHVGSFLTKLHEIPGTTHRLYTFLREIATYAYIEKKLSTHLARHTFATTVTLNNDVPIETVSKMLGHSDVKMTRIYARLLDKKVGQDMSKLYEKY